MAAWQVITVAPQIQKLVYPACTLVPLAGASTLTVPAVIVSLCFELIVQVTIPALAIQVPMMLVFLSVNRAIHLVSLAMDQQMVTV